MLLLPPSLSTSRSHYCRPQPLCLEGTVTMKALIPLDEALDQTLRATFEPAAVWKLVTYHAKHAMATLATLKKWQCGGCEFPRSTTQIPDPTMYTLNHFIMPHCEKCRKVTKNPIWWEQKMFGMWRRVRPDDFTEAKIAKW